MISSTQRPLPIQHKTNTKDETSRDFFSLVPEVLLFLSLYALSILVSLSWFSWLVPLSIKNTDINAPGGIQTRNPSKREATGIGGFEPAIPVIWWLQTNSLDLAATVTGYYKTWNVKIINFDTEIMFLLRHFSISRQCCWKSDSGSFLRRSDL